MSDAGPKIGAVWLLLGLSAACAASSPRFAFDSYRQAVQRADTASVAAMHSDRQPSLTDAGRLAEFKAQHPALWQAAAERLSGDVRAVRLSAELQLTTGATVTMVRQNGRWRVDGGTLWLPGAETPEAALQTLVDGIASGDLAAVRSIMPEDRQSAFATDTALKAHLDRIRGRVAAAVARIGRIRPGIARVTGDRAFILYQGQRRVRFVWQAKRWRVLDVE